MRKHDEKDGCKHAPHGEKRHGRHGPDFTISKDDSPQDALLMRLRACGHFLRHRTEGKGGQRRILAILGEHNPISQRELTEILHIQPGSLSEILGKIEGNAWIERRQNEADKRNVDISLTQQGAAALEEMNERHGRAAVNLFAELSQAEIEQLSALLDKLLGAWRAQDHRGHKGHAKGDRP